MDFAFTRVKITQSAKGGYNIRARTDEYIELQVSAYETATSYLNCGLYPVKFISVDIFNDKISFWDEKNVKLLEVDGDTGTKIINQSLGIWKKETPITDDDT